MDDTSGPVRDATAEALGTLLKVMGERPLNPYIEQLDKIKMDKVIDMLYLSNRPQYSVGYRLINHLGCWWNKRRIPKPRAAFTNSSRVLPTSQVVYQSITHRNLWSIAFI